MGSKSFRIQTTAGGSDKYLKVQLEQEVDLVEILSLKISQKDLYASFNGDFGVLVGRVIANGGVGIPNAKVSIFIPISEDDKLNSDILSIYPYSTPRDKNLDGVRYNLLPRVATNNPFLIAGEYLPVVPIGTFPTKEEITTNQTYIEVFEKYYKYTTVTNNSGDYMIYGAPIGNQTVHMSVDITDIGKYSMNPSTMITSLGYSANLFSDNGTKVKFSTDLDTLPNVETQEIAVDIKSFWGDDVNFSIGITRQDFKIRATLVGTFTLFGSAFTDNQGATFGQGGSGVQQLYKMAANDLGRSMATKRNGIINETIFYIPPTISDAIIAGGTFNTTTDYKVLDSSQYSTYKANGEFVYIIPCNRKKIITKDDGSEVEVDHTSPIGVFTEFVGFTVFSYGDLIQLPVDHQGDLNSNTANASRLILKFPQDTSINLTADNTFGSNESNATNEVWRKQHYIFQGSKFYSIARFMGTRGITGTNPGDTHTQFTNNLNTDPNLNVGLVIAQGGGSGANAPYYEFPSNLTLSSDSNPKRQLFGVEWLNFCAYFPQITYYPGRITNDGNAGVTTYMTTEDSSTFFLNDNAQLIADSKKNTKWFGRSDINRTAFINVPKEDILNIITQTELGVSPQGFYNTQPPYNMNPLIGTDYKGLTGTKYFYKGLSSTNEVAINGNADVFLYMRSLNII